MPMFGVEAFASDQAFNANFQSTDFLLVWP